MFFHIVSPGSFDIDAGDGGVWVVVGGGGENQLGQLVQKVSPKIFRTEIVHTSCTFFEQSQTSQTNL